MRIPIDNNTTGYVYEYDISNITREVIFKPSNIKSELTFSQFKERYKCNELTTLIANPVHLAKIKELAKTFVFKIPNK